ncbi:MAG: 2OG-Fe(II) oxygenase family protein [Pseudomonadota bacterium]
MIEVCSDLAVDAARQQLADNGFAQLAPFLSPSSAAQLAAELAAEKDWDLAVTGRSGPLAISATELREMPAAQQAAIAENLRRQARAGFSFSYMRRDVLPAQVTFCAAWAQWLAAPESLAFWQTLTGNTNLKRADAHACLYRPGHFLRTHDDTYSGKERRFAYVMNLTQEWEPDWGGLLHFVRDGVSHGALTPSFNGLNIFRVPQDHFVSQVASYARQGRYSITGWLFE